MPYKENKGKNSITSKRIFQGRKQPVSVGNGSFASIDFVYLVYTRYKNRLLGDTP